MAKCAKCSKLVSKKCPGIQCGRCNKWVHAACASLTNEQLAALYATEAVDWKCRGCNSNSKKRISVILPEDDDNTDTDSVTPGITSLDANSKLILSSLLATIRSEIRDAIQEELKNTMQFYSDKIDDYQITIDRCEDKIKILENQCKDLNNRYINIKNNFESVQIKLNTLEQDKMENMFEISGIQKEEEENLTEVVKKIGNTLNQDADKDIIKVFRKQGKVARDRTASIVVVSMRDGRKDQWLEAAKSKTITPRDIGRAGEGRIYLREALTPATAYLLWKTKSELKDTKLVQFVWCKRGNILIRKAEKDKIFSIKSENDVEKWVSMLKT